MAIFGEKLPWDMLTEVANHVDIQTVPYLRVSCKHAYRYVDINTFRERVIEDTKNKLEKVINLIKDFHNMIHHDPKAKVMLTSQLLKDFSKHVFEERDVYNFPTDVIKAQIRRFAEFAECHIDDATRVWIASCNEQAIPEEDALIYKALQNYVVGSHYSFAYQYMDRKEVSTYYTHGYVEFSENGECAVTYCIQDIKNGKDITHEHKEAIARIPGAHLDSDGLIQLKVNLTSQSTTLNELARFVVETFGLDNAMYDTDMVSYIKPSSYLSFPKVNEVFEGSLKMDICAWRDRLIAILDGIDE